VFDRRDVLSLLAGAAASPLLPPAAARAQAPATPTVGFLYPTSLDTESERLRALRQGLKETGHIEGENVAIQYRWADNQIDRLPALAADVVRLRPAVIVASGGRAVVLAAKAATATIPIVFLIGEDPVRLGLVASLARPGGNLTGINFLAVELASKRLELLRDMVPGIARVTVLVSPANAANMESTLRDVDAAARAMGLQVQVLRANTSREIDAAFATFGRERPDALFVASGPLFTSRRVQLALLAARYQVPAIYAGRQIAEAGGLISYGASLSDAFRQVGDYAGRILKGAKPAELPVVQSSKFELVINHQTARMLGLTVPPTLLATADEVIE
jgi:putative ABC transport system substrate-binding protein